MQLSQRRHLSGYPNDAGSHCTESTINGHHGLWLIDWCNWKQIRLMSTDLWHTCPGLCRWSIRLDMQALEFCRSATSLRSDHESSPGDISPSSTPELSSSNQLIQSPGERTKEEFELCTIEGQKWNQQQIIWSQQPDNKIAVFSTFKHVL